jgi:predicted secreted protein
MKRSHHVPIALTFALIMPLATLVATAQQPAAPSSTTDANGTAKVVTEADNGSTVTLGAGEVLVVQLKESPSTGYSRALVSFPDMPVRLVSHQLLPNAPTGNGGVAAVGAPRVAEWRFVAAGDAAFGRTVWLKMLYLRPFAKGIENAGLWEIKVNVPKTVTG